MYVHYFESRVDGTFNTVAEDSEPWLCDYEDDSLHNIWRVPTLDWNCED
jgi:hypothetical protein